MGCLYTKTQSAGALQAPVREPKEQRPGSRVLSLAGTEPAASISIVWPRAAGGDDACDRNDSGSNANNASFTSMKARRADGEPAEADARPQPQPLSPDVMEPFGAVHRLKLELYQTEVTYVRGLISVCDHYLEPLNKMIALVNSTTEITRRRPSGSVVSPASRASAPPSNCPVGRFSWALPPMSHSQSPSIASPAPPTPGGPGAPPAAEDDGMIGAIVEQMFGHLMNIRACNVTLLRQMQRAVEGQRRRGSAEAAAGGEGGAESPSSRAAGELPEAAPPGVDFSNVDVAGPLAESGKVLRSYAEYICGYNQLKEFLDGSTRDAVASPQSAADSSAPSFRLFRRDSADSAAGEGERKNSIETATTQADMLRVFLLETESRLEGEAGTELQRDPSLWGYLITPIQRLAQYKVLLTKLRQLVEDSRLDAAITEISAVANYCNDRTRETLNAPRLAEIASLHKLPDLLDRPGRSLILEECLTKIGSAAPSRPSYTCSVYLFSDLLLSVGLSSSWGVTKVQKIFRIALADVETVEPAKGDLARTGFVVHAEGGVALGFVAINAQRRDHWIAAILDAQAADKRGTRSNIVGLSLSDRV